MKKALLLTLAIAVIPAAVDAQVTRLEQMRADAEAGDADAQFFFGGYYEHGMGGAVDHIESEHWYRLAAEQGHADAQQAVGYKYATGWGIPTDEVEGVRWYRLAAEQGHWLAQHRLASMYWGGTGVPQDYVRAYMWFNLVAARGQPPRGWLEEARDYRGRVAEQMTREQIAEAKRLSREWIEAHPRGGN